MAQEVQKTIVKQLGGNRFAAMTGAQFIADGENTLIVKFRGSREANIMYITYQPGADLYDLKIAKYRGLNVKTVKEVEGCYEDMLIPIFEKTTGLCTSL